MNRARHALSIAVVSIATTVTMSAGGWAVITVGDPPEYIRAGEPVTIAYSVRQHGHNLLPGLNGRVEATNGAGRVVAAAQPGKRPGHYTATLTLPTPGDWSVTIESGFGGLGKLALLPLKAVERSARPARLDAPTRGQQLFVAKGCATCHTVAGKALPAPILHGPALVPYKYQSEYLARVLANPALLPPIANYAFRMPNLELEPADIDSLVAFINNRPRAHARAGGRK